VKTNVLRLPPVERLLADPDFPDQLHDWHSDFGLLQHANDLLHPESLPLHQQNLLSDFAED
jgi:hypothetical protein